MNKCASSENCFIILDRKVVKTSLLLRGYQALQRVRSGCLYMAEHWCRNTYCKHILHSIKMILSSQQPSFLLRTSNMHRVAMNPPHAGIMWTITVSSLTWSPWTWLFMVRVPIWPKLGQVELSLGTQNGNWKGKSVSFEVSGLQDVKGH